MKCSAMQLLSTIPSNQGILNHWWPNDHSLAHPWRIGWLALANIGSPSIVLLHMLHAKSLLDYHCYSFCRLNIMRQYWQTKIKKFQDSHCSANSGGPSQANQPEIQENKYIYNSYPSRVKINLLLCFIFMQT